MGEQEVSMKIGVLGTGMVGESIGTKLVALGHDVVMGSRSATNEKAVAWAKATGKGHVGTFANAAIHGDILFNCTGGMVSLEALHMAGSSNLNGKILVDVANPLDFSKGMPPTLSVCNSDSLGEQVQRAFPGTKVVKALNTLNCDLMVNPAKLAGEHDLFICGNDAGAKATVVKLLKEEFGWKTIHDLGDITAARGLEMILPIWLRIMGAVGGPNFNFHIAR
jgi:predicted dinucleotide-binding enzyme